MWLVLCPLRGWGNGKLTVVDTSWDTSSTLAVDITHILLQTRSRDATRTVCHGAVGVLTAEERGSRRLNCCGRGKSEKGGESGDSELHFGWRFRFRYQMVTITSLCQRSDQRKQKIIWEGRNELAWTRDIWGVAVRFFYILLTDIIWATMIMETQDYRGISWIGRVH